MPSVSVVIPVFGRETLIRDALESVFMQTYPVCQVIVCDDGSPKPIVNGIKPYISKIIYIRSEENNGVSAARNAGIKAAKGKYVAFLDSDDLWLPNKLSVQIKRMEERGFQLSHTDEFWYKRGKWLNQGSKHKRYGGFVFPKVLDMCRVSPSSLIIKNGIGLFDEKLRVCEDYEFILRMSLNHQIDYVEKKLLIKRAVTDDQLSAGIKHIESVRLGILERFAETCGNMSEENNAALNNELSRKRAITGGRSI